MPTVCEVCGATLVDDGTRLYCPNETCRKRALFRIRKWLGILDIRDFGDVILRKLFDAGLVNEIADLYRLTPGDLASFERMGETLAAKIIRNLTAVTSVPLSKFVAGFNVEGVGTLTMDKVIAAGFDTLDKLRGASTEELASIPGIGEILARTIVDGIAQLSGEMERTLETGAVSIEEAAGGSLTGKSFCFTGTLSSMSRSEAQDRVRAAGGVVRSGVTKDLTYLVTNEPGSGSSKNRKAAELGVRVIGEQEFLSLLSE